MAFGLVDSTIVITCIEMSKNKVHQSAPMINNGFYKPRHKLIDFKDFESWGLLEKVEEAILPCTILEFFLKMFMLSRGQTTREGRRGSPPLYHFVHL